MSQAQKIIKVGSIVKISRGGESFWNKVTKISGNTVYATVDNVLVSYRKKLGDPIRFKLQDIICVFLTK